MAPTKRKAAVIATDTATAAEPTPAVPGRRVTRGLTRQLQNSGTNSVQPPPSKKIITKKPKKEEKEDVKTTALKNETTTTNGDVASKGLGPTLVIEHCKQCHRFKTRALQVQKSLEKDVPGVTVMINPEKPRRGCFEIRLKDGQTFISLLDMKRPFKPMTDLDMDEVIADIIGKIKA